MGKPQPEVPFFPASPNTCFTEPHPGYQLLPPLESLAGHHALHEWTMHFLGGEVSCAQMLLAQQWPSGSLGILLHCFEALP